jgi:TRAP-type mannitol/chloroaromatic compound transport system substrate-binding protein
MEFNTFVEKTLNGLGKGKSVADLAKMHNVSTKVIQQQLKAGTKVEKEHTSSNKKAKQIAKDHLAERPRYYTMLKKAEKNKL